MRLCTWVLVVPLMFVVACIPPRSFKQVRNPRAGRPLGGRICIVYSQRCQIDFAGLEKLHPFDINKYAKIYLQLLTDGILEPVDIFVPDEATTAQLRTVHSDAYLRSLREPGLLAEYLEFGPLAISPPALSDAAILRPFRQATGGTILAARLALRHGMAVNLGGGYHHAEPDRGGGFCVYADMPIAIRLLQAERLIDRAMVIDLDVHQGNGTALCIADDDRVFTYDAHEEDIYPVPKQTNDWDVPLPRGVTDEMLLELLRRYLPEAFDRARPDIVFYQSGVDGLVGDPLAHWNLTPVGIAERDRLVFAEAHRRGVPIVMVLGGGYSERAWEAQYRSIRALLAEYGNATPDASLQRNPTAKEKIYTK